MAGVRWLCPGCLIAWGSGLGSYKRADEDGLKGRRCSITIVRLLDFFILHYWSLGSFPTLLTAGYTWIASPESILAG